MKLGTRTVTRGAWAAGLALAGAAYAQPANNACSNATLVANGTVNGTTIAATNDGNGGCGNSGTSADVWYRYLAASNRQLVASTIGGANWDTVLSIHTGCPGNTSNVLTCNDDTNGLQSRVQVSMTQGNTYYIRVAGFGGATGAFALTVSEQDPPPPPTNGPDVIVGDLIDVGYYGAFDGTTALAVGTTSCNRGDAPVEWIADNNQHPVIAQNLYRLHNGRMEHIGQSWLKHGFASVNGTFCGPCTQPPGGGSQLGIGCSDPYGSGLNGDQGNLGPRSHVNPTTGFYPYPFETPGAGYIVPPNPPGGAAGIPWRRIWVRTSDLMLPATGARFFVEGHYITRDDASFTANGRTGNGLNNASYREVRFNSVTAAPTFVGGTIQMKSAIEAWRDVDGAVQLVNADHLDGGITTRHHVATKVTNNNNGTWTYVHAVHNLNANKPAREFSVPIPSGVTITNVGFSAPLAHSGEPYDNGAWTGVHCSGGLVWSPPRPQGLLQPNHIRWGTTYTFWYTANAGPTARAGALSLAGTGNPVLPVDLSGPAGDTGCVADVDDGSGSGTPDGGVNIDDLLYYLVIFGEGAAAADIDNGSGCGTADGGVNIDDLLYYLVRFDAGC